MLRAAYWLALVFFAALVLAKFDSVTGFTALIRFGDTWQAQRLPVMAGVPVATVSNSSGYDGQFYAQLALDPALRDAAGLEKALDSPAYRARRILLPAIAHVMVMGRPQWVLNLYALLNVATWFWLAWILYRELGSADTVAFARWFGCMFSMGALESVRQSLVDLPAMLLLILAIRQWQVSRPARSGFWLALGHLAKETNLLGSFALAAYPRPDFRRMGLLALTAVPLAIWVAYVSSRFATPAAGGWGNFTWPFVGVVAQLRLSATEVFQGNLDSRHAFALLAVAGLSVQAISVWRRWLPGNAWWRIGVAYSVLVIFLSSWVWSGYWAAMRAVLPLTFAFNVLLPAGRAFWPLWIAGNLTILHAVWRFL